MFKISLNNIDKLFSLISENQDLILPIEKANKVGFYQWDENQIVRLDKLNTVKSAKDFFFPQTEDIASFKVSGKNIEINPAEDCNKPTVYFGVRPCDVKSFEILDKVFLSEPVDSFYESRRNNGTIVSIGCAKPENTCFCHTFDVDATKPEGDIAAWIVNEEMFFEAKTKKGEDLIEIIRPHLHEGDVKALEAQQNEVKDFFANYPLARLSVEGFRDKEMKDLFETEKWSTLSTACIACGTCTFVCPTCQCYDIKDFDSGKEVKRYRCWDSCMYSDFTLMAHGNNRNSQVERFRQRFMHKLVYFPANNEGEFSCVGCGRCLNMCPSSLNIVKVIKALGGNQNE